MVLRRQHPAELRLVEPVAGGAGGGADRRRGQEAVLVVRRALDPSGRRPAAVAAAPPGRPVAPLRRAVDDLAREGAPVLAHVDDGVGRRRVPQFVGELARADARVREEHRDGAVAAPSALHAFEVIAPFALRIDARVDGAGPPGAVALRGPVEQVARRPHRRVDLVQEAVVIAREGLQRRQREGEDSAEASHYFLGGPILCLTPLTVARPLLLSNGLSLAPTLASRYSYFDLLIAPTGCLTGV